MATSPPINQFDHWLIVLTYITLYSTIFWYAGFVCDFSDWDFRIGFENRECWYNIVMDSNTHLPVRQRFRFVARTDGVGWGRINQRSLLPIVHKGCYCSLAKSSSPIQHIQLYHQSPLNTTHKRSLFTILYFKPNQIYFPLIISILLFVLFYTNLIIYRLSNTPLQAHYHYINTFYQYNINQ